MNIGINWDFSKKNVMVFLNSQYLSEYKAGREIDTNSFDAKINQVRQKILHLYAKGNYYNFSVFEVVQYKQSRGVK